MFGVSLTLRQGSPTGGVCPHCQAKLRPVVRWSSLAPFVIAGLCHLSFQTVPSPWNRLVVVAGVAIQVAIWAWAGYEGNGQNCR